VADKSINPELIERLVVGISSLTSSEQWHRYLNFQSRFHRYSFSNTLLIQLTCPFGGVRVKATRVAGFTAWHNLGRMVRTGEKAIWILAPVARRVRYGEHTTVDAELEGREIVAFKRAAVFDIAQTVGEEVPAVVDRLRGDDPCDSYGRLVGVANAIGYSVEMGFLADGQNGDCAMDTRRIRIEARNEQVQQVKTLAHELAHAMLHDHLTERALAELEAESVAYIVCDALGIDSGAYSFAYVATWAGGGDKAIVAIREAGSRIQRGVAEIVKRLENTSGTRLETVSLGQQRPMDRTTMRVRAGLGAG
jgi:antirestriction protein ArdC